MPSSLDLSNLPDADVVSWPDSSHFPHLAHPDAFADIITTTAAW